MSHWIIAPVLVPLVAAAAMLAARRARIGVHRTIAAATVAMLAACAIRLTVDAAGAEPVAYAIGDWPAPFGIVLVLDRLAALMLLLITVVGAACLVASLQGWDTRGSHFHPLLQLQLMGLNGAVLTGDLFNLFVFFEVLLIASYGMLLHGDAPKRVPAALHYVVVNLAASALFLLGASLLYGATGTLNLADLAIRAATTGPDDIALLRAGGMILFVVFAVKAAALPLNFWLQPTYGAASPPVAALFAVMTKVGVYSILRVHTVVFGTTLGAGGALLEPWLVPVGLATLAVASLAALGARDLLQLVTWLVAGSAGTMLVGAGLMTAEGHAATLYYMTHSTITAALFLLLAHRIGAPSGVVGGAAPVSQAGCRSRLDAPIYLYAAIAIAGLPPLSGFVGKLGLLQAATGSVRLSWIWAVMLAAGLVTMIALVRAGTTLFWKTEPVKQPPPARVPGRDWTLVTICALALAVAGLTVAAPGIYGYMQATAAEITNPAGYVRRVLFPRPSGPILDTDRLRGQWLQGGPA
jgi:multicomponent K+:H+ antiporter subunit D